MNKRCDQGIKRSSKHWMLPFLDERISNGCCPFLDEVDRRRHLILHDEKEGRNITDVLCLHIFKDDGMKEHT